MTTKPNRTREQSTGSEEARRKQSGDQHTELADEASDAPHRPHRTNRIDMDKTGTGDRQPDDAAST